MDFSLNDEQKMMIDTIRRFIAEELHPLEDELDETRGSGQRQSAAPFTQVERTGLVRA